MYAWVLFLVQFTDKVCKRDIKHGNSDNQCLIDHCDQQWQDMMTKSLQGDLTDQALEKCTPSRCQLGALIPLQLHTKII